MCLAGRQMAWTLETLCSHSFEITRTMMMWHFLSGGLPITMIRWIQRELLKIQIRKSQRFQFSVYWSACNNALLRCHYFEFDSVLRQFLLTSDERVVVQLFRLPCKHVANANARIRQMLKIISFQLLICRSFDDLNYYLAAILQTTTMTMRKVATQTI